MVDPSWILILLGNWTKMSWYGIIHIEGNWYGQMLEPIWPARLTVWGWTIRIVCMTKVLEV